MGEEGNGEEGKGERGRGGKGEEGKGGRGENTLPGESSVEVMRGRGGYLERKRVDGLCFDRKYVVLILQFTADQ
jgi:hypothetical protein